MGVWCEAGCGVRGRRRNGMECVVKLGGARGARWSEWRGRTVERGRAGQLANRHAGSRNWHTVRECGSAGGTGACSGTGNRTCSEACGERSRCEAGSGIGMHLGTRQVRDENTSRAERIYSLFFFRPLSSVSCSPSLVFPLPSPFPLFPLFPFRSFSLLPISL